MRMPRFQGRDVASALVAGFVVILVLFMIVRQAQSIDRLRSNYDNLHLQYQQLYSEAVDAGASPEAPKPEDVPETDPETPAIEIPEAVPAPGPSGPPGLTGARGPAPTRAQVAAAVERLFATGEFDGEDGRPPTRTEVTAAVERYCAEDSCDGEPGADGADGEDGIDGAPGATGATGAQGPPPSAEQIRAALDAYCAEQPGGSCEGAAGQDGAKGDTGDRGPAGPSGTARPDSYDCTAGQEYMVGFEVLEDGSVTPHCESFSPLD